MGLLLLGALLFVVFVLWYPTFVSAIKLGDVRHQARAAVARVALLEHALEELRARVAVLEAPAVAAVPDPVEAVAPEPEPEPEPEPIPIPIPIPIPMITNPPPEEDAKTTVGIDVTAYVPLPPAVDIPPVPYLQDATPAWVRAIKTWLFTGNIVAKFGLLILIIGIGFLVTYTAQHVTVPIELRLAGVVVADIALLLWGWRIRTRRRDVALPVQGAALAILMVVVFGAFQRLHLIPAALAFPLLVALTVFTCVLALLQDAIWLAVFGIIGGFVAPLLVSTGSGNYVALFSYDALLNAGILALALRRDWRALNLLGFAATFLVGGAWGWLRYLPENYAWAQAFLILFFLFYVGIALAWAHRRAPRFNDAVDATLVFGTPAAACAMQYGLVKDMPFGTAFSALALGLFYIGLAAVLRRRGNAQPLLVATFIALATIFGTLAIPFALSGTWTASAWALEGAGLIWVGLRQRRALAWTFGLLVQGGAWITFFYAHWDMLVWRGHADLGALLTDAALLAAAAAVSGWLLRSDESGKRRASHTLLVGTGGWWFLLTLWWAAEGLARLGGDSVFYPVDADSGSLQVALYTGLAAASGLAAALAARKLAWPALRWLALPAWIVLAAASVTLLRDLYGPAGWPTLPQALGWIVAWLCGDILLRRWQAAPWPLASFWLKCLHLLRIGMPWLMLWPLCARLIASWLPSTRRSRIY